MPCSRLFRLLIALVVALPSLALAETVLRVGNMGEPETLDPHHTSGVWESRILRDAFLGLTTEAADATIIPGAAESWTISDDGTVYTFKIRDHVWSDGTPVTAHDFVFSFTRILLPETAAKYASLLYPILNGEAVNSGQATPDTLGVKAIDDQTLEITLEAPTPFFLSQLAHQTSYPVPKHVVEQHGDDWIKPAIWFLTALILLPNGYRIPTSNRLKIRSSMMRTMFRLIP